MNRHELYTEARQEALKEAMQLVSPQAQKELAKLLGILDGTVPKSKKHEQPEVKTIYAHIFK